MAKMDPDQLAELEFQANLRRALATPPISNDEILHRSKQAKGVDKKSRRDSKNPDGSALAV